MIPEQLVVRTDYIVNGNLWQCFPVINVDKVKDIPADYPGAMGVPITFLDKFSREQQDAEYQQDWVSDWLYGWVCDDCPKKECCEENVFRCKNVLFVMLGKEALKDDKDV